MNRLDEEILKVLDEKKEYDTIYEKGSIENISYLFSFIKRTGFKCLKVKSGNAQNSLILESPDNFHVTGRLSPKWTRKSANANSWVLQWEVDMDNENAKEFLFQTIIKAFPDYDKEYGGSDWSCYYFYTNPILGRATETGDRTSIEDLAVEFNDILRKIDTILSSYFEGIDKELEEIEKQRSMRNNK